MPDEVDVLLEWVGALVFVGEALRTGGAGALAGVEEGAAVEDDAWADFCSSCLAFCWEAATAPWAFAIAPVRPATPGAEPW